MGYADDPIPEDGISVPDAFETVCRTFAPDAGDRANRDDLPEYDLCSRQRASASLREHLSQGTLVALFWDPEKKKYQQVSRHLWASMGSSSRTLSDQQLNAIASSGDFGPVDAGAIEAMGVFETGVAIIGGVRRTVFFNRKEFEGALSGTAQPRTKNAPRIVDKGGRPPEYDWDAIKALALERMAVLGKPHRKNKRLPTKAQLIELIQTEWADQFDQHLPTSLVRWHLNQWLAENDQN